MRIIFIGSVKFSESALLRLIDLKVEIVGIGTVKSSKFNSDHVNLSYIAKKNNIDFFYFTDINNEDSVNWIKNKYPDIIFCFGLSKIIKSDILAIAPMGVLGFHPTLLPSNRGRHPIIWSLALGLVKTGSTFFFMDDGVDSGDILVQDKITIDSKDDAETLYNKITNIALLQISSFIPKLISGSYDRIKQNHSKANYWRKRQYSDGQIDWRMSSKMIYNLVRSLTKPYVGAHFVYKNCNFKVWSCDIVQNSKNNYEPGKVIDKIKKNFIVKTGDGAIKIKNTEPNINIKIGDYL
tara:strand:+ start:54 stop:935 length:882 start_codon:yes stop_codon:yes gene_type:complete